jgi:phosphatidylethanolamine/phosphatidyl-N-methylethanolamine N-methyltransferase
MKEKTSSARRSFFRRLLGPNHAHLKKLLSSDTFLFLSEFLKDPQKVGSLVPSSENLGAAITRYMTQKKVSSHAKYLEVGAGTGSFTTQIILRMDPNDHLDLVELDPNFCKLLETKFSKYNNVKIHCCSILSWNPRYKYDLIISSLPLNALEPSVVDNIFQKYELLIKSQGMVSFFEYIGLPEIKKIFLNDKDKTEFKKTLALILNFSEKYEIASDKVLANFPPAIVHHCKIFKEKLKIK